MPRCCSVSGCKSNYRSEKETTTTFALPKSEPLRSEWLRKIPTDFGKLKNPIVCIKHFHESCIVRSDSFVVDGQVKEYARKIPKLKEGSVPTIFPNVPKYLSSVPTTRRTFEELESANIETATRLSLEEHKRYMAAKEIKSSQDVIAHFTKHRCKFREGWTVVANECKAIFGYVNFSSEVPDILCSLVVFNNLDFEVCVEKNKLSKKRLPQNLKHLNSVNVFDSLIEFMENEAITQNEVNRIDSAIEALQSCDSSLLKFLCEQLQLHQTQKIRECTKIIQWFLLPCCMFILLQHTMYFINPICYVFHMQGT